jgi:ubiquinol-cytochrome c reductase cytochrome c1 subunit
MNKLASIILAVLALCAAGAVSASESDVRMPPAPVDRLDQESLQRGARNFVNYCLNCHSARYMRYNRLQDIGLTEAQIKDNLMFATDKVGDTMTSAMKPEDAKRFFNAIPPDLSVEARVRGADWLYAYFLAFYRDDKSATGWNNLVFPNVGMPHVLWQLGGTNKLVETEFEDHEKAEGAAIAARGLAKVEPAPSSKYVVLTLAQDTPGALSRSDYEAFVADLVNYMEYMAEPSRNDRMRLGIIVLLFLGVLFVLAYWTKVEFWKDLH